MFSHAKCMDFTERRQSDYPGWPLRYASLTCSTSVGHISRLGARSVANQPADNAFRLRCPDPPDALLRAQESARPLAFGLRHGDEASRLKRSLRTPTSRKNATAAPGSQVCLSEPSLAARAFERHLLRP